MNNTIPIFPLNLVVFPFSKVPLHIFEERYKKMINKCLDEKTGFGIVSLIFDEISKVGSYVEIATVERKKDNGEMDIIVKGTGRFKILKTINHPDGYLVATINEYSDDSDDINVILLKELRENFEEIIKKINFTLEDSFWKNYDDTLLKSFKIAEKSGLNLKQRQKLLSLRKENERINFLLEHFTKLEKKISERFTAGAIVMGDGYIN
jgi:ATP-dependent Lon protease